MSHKSTFNFVPVRTNIQIMFFDLPITPDETEQSRMQRAGASFVASSLTRRTRINSPRCHGHFPHQLENASGERVGSSPNQIHQSRATCCSKHLLIVYAEIMETNFKKYPAIWQNCGWAFQVFQEFLPVRGFINVAW